MNRSQGSTKVKLSNIKDAFVKRDRVVGRAEKNQHPSSDMALLNVSYYGYFRQYTLLRLRCSPLGTL